MFASQRTHTNWFGIFTCLRRWSPLYCRGSPGCPMEGPEACSKPPSVLSHAFDITTTHEFVDLCSGSPSNHRLRKHQQRLSILFAEAFGVRSHSCVSTTAKPCQDPSSMSKCRGESAPKVSPVRYSTCVTKPRTDWTALSAPPLLSCGVCWTCPCGDSHLPFYQVGLYLVSNPTNGRFFV